MRAEDSLDITTLDAKFMKHLYSGDGEEGVL